MVIIANDGLESLAFIDCASEINLGITSKQ